MTENQKDIIRAFRIQLLDELNINVPEDDPLILNALFNQKIVDDAIQNALTEIKSQWLISEETLNLIVEDFKKENTEIQTFSKSVKKQVIEEANKSLTEILNEYKKVSTDVLEKNATDLISQMNTLRFNVQELNSTVKNLDMNQKQKNNTVLNFMIAIFLMIIIVLILTGWKIAF